ncbi:hypothetical protein H9Y04_44780 [Streptomyces sp. TRM66268-LWL]|uniref:Uncharacterized protein n=1 Tax=Streptomyces polyasparticus TaxID=2767826 RepID=A0ABR7SW39_9ACTN|nr:hypothetical protein [Streptomyces polyasparticus]MBC9719613.1 hypothetical protein [Streptomyces polyasparticus]
MRKYPLMLNGREVHPTERDGMFGRAMQLEMPVELAVFTLMEQLERRGFTVLARYDQPTITDGRRTGVLLSLWHVELNSEAVKICPDAAVLGLATAVVRSMHDTGRTHVRLPDPAILLMLSDCSAMDAVARMLTRLIDEAMIATLMADMPS